MRRLFFTIILGTFASLTISNAQSCKVDVIALKAKIETDPSSVLYRFGDAIAMFPHCMADFLEAAIVASDPDDATLTQIIQLAVSEYPAKAGTIAEAAVLAAPEDVDVIRKAFIPSPKAIVAKPVNEVPQKKSPIENFLTNYRPLINQPAPAIPPTQEVSLPKASQQFLTSTPTDPEDIAITAMAAIDELLANLDGTEQKTELFTEEKPLATPQTFEKFRLNETDERIAISTINDPAHHDLNDETLDTPADQPLRFKDPEIEINVVEAIKETVKEVAMADSKKTSQPVKFTSSVYHIPSPGDLTDESERTAPPSLRSSSISPTLPRAKR